MPSVSQKILSSWPVGGCSLIEAIERTTPPRLLAKFEHLRELAAQRPQLSFMGGDRGYAVHEERALLRQHRQDFARCKHNIENKFRKVMQSGVLGARGRLGGLKAQQIWIEEDFWLSVSDVAWDQSAIQGGDGTVFYAVRVFHVKPTERDRLQPGTLTQPKSQNASEKLSPKRRRPVADAVKQALKKHGLEQGPGNLPFNEIAGMITRDMPKPPRAAHELEALAKAVARFYKRPSKAA